MPKLNVKNINIFYENDIYNDFLKSIFNDDEITILKNIFNNNNDLFIKIINKLIILTKSKEVLNKKYEYEKKKINEKIVYLKKQIECLEIKIKEKEMLINISNSKINENNNINRNLIKKVRILENNNKNSEMKNNLSIINENNLEEVDNILKYFDKKKNIINVGDDNNNIKKNDIFKIDKDKQNDNKIYIKLIKK